MSNGTSQDQTLASQWSTSNATIASVNATGLVTASANGSVTVTAIYQGVTGARAVVVGIAPPKTVTLTGTVTDDTSKGILPNIHIDIISGTNAGKSTLTDAAGNYSISGLTPGTFTLSASATSYQTVTMDVTMSSDQRMDIVLPRVPAPAPATQRLTIFLDGSSCSGKIASASVAIDGASIGLMTPGSAFSRTVTVGTHSVTASSSRYSWDVTVPVPGDAPTGLRLVCP
jgi:hypothetical protein